LDPVTDKVKKSAADSEIMYWISQRKREETHKIPAQSRPLDRESNTNKKQPRYSVSIAIPLE